MNRLPRDRTWIAVGALTLLGLALRVLAARGALWLDEAWSATFAQEAATPIGVVWRVNHDNNHILNSWWLQFVGADAPPMLQRALSIACGTLAIPLAARIARPASPASALVAATCFAISPVLVTFGSEARGYAPMILALMALVAIVQAWLAREQQPSPIVLAVITLVGMLAQILLLPPLLAVGGWAWLTLARRDGWRAATRAAIAVLGPSLVAAAAVLIVMAIAASQSADGFRFGSYTPFAAGDWISGVATAFVWGLGVTLPRPLAALLMIGTVAGGLWLLRRSPRLPLYLIMVVAYPLAFVLARVGNVGIPRLYLAAVVVALIAVAEGAPLAWRRDGVVRGLLILVGGGALVGAMLLDRTLLVDRRSDSGAAIEAMRRAARAGTEVMVPDARMVPVAQWAARAAGYPLRVIGTGCTQAPFLWLDNDRPKTMPRTLYLCCGTYHLIAARPARALSGTDWWLYARVPRS